MIRLPKKTTKPSIEKESPWPADALFEYSSFGEKIMIFPRSEVWVLDILGNPIQKKDAIPLRRDQHGRIYYINRRYDASELEKIDQSDYKPSVWDDAKEK